MLSEIQHVRQIEGEGTRRWFADSLFDPAIARLVLDVVTQDPRLVEEPLPAFHGVAAGKGR